MTSAWRLPEFSDVFLSCYETNLRTLALRDNNLTVLTGFVRAGASTSVSNLGNLILQDRQDTNNRIENIATLTNIPRLASRTRRSDRFYFVGGLGL